MKRAYDDPFARKPRQDAPARHFDGTVTALGIIVLTILSAVLLVLSRFEHSIVHQMRMATVELLAPALKVVSEPLAPLRRASATQIERSLRIHSTAKPKSYLFSFMVL